MVTPKQVFIRIPSEFKMFFGIHLRGDAIIIKRPALIYIHKPHEIVKQKLNSKTTVSVEIRNYKVNVLLTNVGYMHITVY